MAGTWQVTGDDPGQHQFDGAGNPVVGHVVAFITGQGHRGSVFVPDDHYSADTVRKLITTAARLADQVGTLSGEY